MFEESVEFIRGDKVKTCTGCWAEKEIINFSTIYFGGKRRLTAWCKECMKYKMRPTSVTGLVAVSRAGKVFRRKPKSGGNG